MTSPVRAVLGVFPPEDKARAFAAACEWPTRFDLPLSHFTVRELAAYLRDEIGMSVSTLWRWLNEHALKPWKHQMWIFPRDPLFMERAISVLELYEGRWQGEPLGPDDFVISADEKPGVQILERRHEPTPPAPGRPARLEFEYKRHGTVAYLAALDVQSGRVIGQVDEHTGIEPFMRLVGRVMRQRPYKSARRVFWIVDSGASHHRSTFPDRLRAAFPNAVAVHLPVHASWLNQIEIYFAILQRKLLARGHFDTAHQITDAILRFEDRQNKHARPFNWTFTVKELKERMAYAH